MQIRRAAGRGWPVNIALRNLEVTGVDDAGRYRGSQQLIRQHTLAGRQEEFGCHPQRPTAMLNPSDAANGYS